MKRVTRYGVLLAALVGLYQIIAAAVLPEPEAHSIGGAIAVRWATQDETGLQRFDVLRRAGRQGDFIVIGTVMPKGVPSDYEYLDRSVFKTEDGVYEYKIRLVYDQGPSQDTKVAEVSFLSSTARRTWGSIKAMFR